MLKIENLTINFDGLLAVNNLSFEIQKGEVFGLIGPNGAGKTTCFNMISGTLEPTSGNIFLEEEQIGGKNMFEINRKGIARTYQNISLFGNMTVLENIMVGEHSVSKCGIFSAIIRNKKQREEEKSIREKALDLLKEVGLLERQEWKANSLSYGDQRRLEIARALASNPKVLLLDEPAAGMNPTEKEELRLLIEQLKKTGLTILLVEHDMKFVMNIVDRICVMNYGERIALGPPEAIQNDENVIEAYLGGGE
mgnify:CR=1 FL=1|jgi:branched-chain amino acid transport system ATP-binding protein